MWQTGGDFIAEIAAERDERETRKIKSNMNAWTRQKVGHPCRKCFLSQRLMLNLGMKTSNAGIQVQDRIRCQYQKSPTIEHFYPTQVNAQERKNHAEVFVQGHSIYQSLHC